MRGRKLDAALGEIVQDDLADREPVSHARHKSGLPEQVMRLNPVWAPGILPAVGTGEFLFAVWRHRPSAAMRRLQIQFPPECGEFGKGVLIGVHGMAVLLSFMESQHCLSFRCKLEESDR